MLESDYCMDNALRSSVRSVVENVVSRVVVVMEQGID